MQLIAGPIYTARHTNGLFKTVITGRNTTTIGEHSELQMNCGSNLIRTFL